MGLFITFEGGEGVGKSLQMKMFSRYLTKSNVKHIVTREPGGTEVAEIIRSALLKGDPNKIDPITEALMYLAARSDHFFKRIKPAIDAGYTVICDRFHDSSVVYQGVCKNVDMCLLNNIYQSITNGLKPHRTYLIDLDPKIGVKRSLRNKKNTETRFENMNISFHQNVRKAFLDIAKSESERFTVIDGNQNIYKIQKIIQKDYLALVNNIVHKT
ncbi:MAG: dTMP kinase [Alphaproteobacteria bacterium]|nr:dTMP kinase [Alphaproteobacteria bacterium]